MDALRGSFVDNYLKETEKDGHLSRPDCSRNGIRRTIGMHV